MNKNKFLALKAKREAFEQVFPCSTGIILNEYGHYESLNQQDTMIQNISWIVWQAAKAQATTEIDELKAKLEAAQVPEGFVLVPKEFNEKLAEKMAAEMVNKPIPENDPVWIEIANKAYKDKLLMKKWEIIRNYKAMIEAAQGEGHD